MSERFINREVDEVVVVYTHFYPLYGKSRNSRRCFRSCRKTARAEAAAARQTEEAIPYEFLPDVKQVFETLLPQYLEIVIYNALLQAAASELGSRMAAMTSATDNASGSH